MFARLASAALLAGFLAAFVTTVLQLCLTSALILEAETFEGRTVAVRAAPARIHQVHALPVHDHDGQGHGTQSEPDEWQPGEGWPRIAFTGLATLVGAVGCAFLLGAVMLALKHDPTPERGLAFGLAGFAAAALAPAIGLPPELPGMGGASLGARQTWWVLTVAATGLGLSLVFLRRAPLALIGGLALIIAPHVVGAPHGAHAETRVPAELAARFAARSLAISVVFWAVIGLAYGWIWNRPVFSKPRPRG